MNCPRCQDERLYSMQYGELIVDRCPNCRGIWLDAGELLDLILLSLPLLRQSSRAELDELLERLRAEMRNSRALA